MAKRYGRNQKRAARAQIERLSNALQRERDRNNPLEALVHAHTRIVNEVVGPDSALHLEPRIRHGHGNRYVLRRNLGGTYLQDPCEVETVSLYLHEFELRVRQDAERYQREVSFVNHTHGGRVTYMVSEEIVRRMGFDPRLAAHITDQMLRALTDKRR